MAEVTSELLFELMKRMHTDLAGLKDGQKDIRQDLLSLRNQIHLLQGDFNTMRGSLAQFETRLDRIENRLELRELQEAQSRFEPHP